MPFGLGFGELLLIFAVFLLLFGAKRLPEVAQGMGKGIRDFKRALNGLDDQSIQGGQSQSQSIPGGQSQSQSIPGGQSQSQSFPGGQSQSPNQSVQANQPSAAPRVQAPVEAESQKIGD